MQLDEAKVMSCRKK